MAWSSNGIGTQIFDLQNTGSTPVHATMTDKIVFDIGANHGDFTEFFLRKGGFTKVVAVEANPAMCTILRERFEKDNVVVVDKAVSKSNDETIDFYICPEADGICTCDEDWHTKGRWAQEYAGGGAGYRQWVKTQVTTITIDEPVKLHGCPSHIKMDIEGHEWIAVQGMSSAYCPLRLEWTEENIDKLETTLLHLQRIGYHYFGTVTENGTLPDGSFDFDQKPNLYFDDVKKMIFIMRNSIKESHRKTKMYHMNTLPHDLKLRELQDMTHWGMMWCARKEDTVELKIK
jgi:FkbM family methyltransferase